MQRPRSNQQDAMSGEFGMWDPSSITSKTSSQPQSAENNYGNLSRGSGSPANSSWHTASEPTTINTTGARSNMYMPEMSNTNSGYDQYPVAPYQSTYSNMQPSGQSSFSDIYYKPPSDLPANNHYYNNSGPTNTAGTMPQSSPSQAYNMNSGPVQNIAQPGGVRSRSDAPNWRSGDNAPEIQNIGSRLSSYAQNQRTYDPPPPRVASVDWQTFQNPLNQTDDDNDSAEQLISSMHKAAETAGAKLENTTRKPAAFSKATIAILEKDLKDAAAPFKSAETLKKFRDMHLGIDKSEVPGNVKVSETEQTADLPPLVAKSKLSVGAKEFIPRSMSPHTVKSMKDLSEEEKEKRAKHDSENETIAINLMDEFIDRLICNPASFDKIVPSTVEQLRSLDLPHSAISIIVDKIYEMCVVEQNFRYLGSQLCDTMSRYSTGLPKFRKTLLEKAKNEFEGMDEALLNGKEEDIKRARGFTQYMAEVFLSLMCEKSTGELERFAVLGRATFGVVRKLIDHPSDDNLQCAVRVLKLTIVSMEESLKDDEKNSMEKLKSILDDLSAFADNSKHPGLKLNELTKNLLDGFVKLRKENWGRVPPEESYPDQSTAQHYPPELLAERDANYYMNEPVFFTPNGVQYTAADAADPDFYNQHLAPYSVHYQPPAHDAARPNQTQPTEPAQFYKDNSSFTCNPMDAVDVPPTHTRMAYTNWSTGDADRYDYACAEDDYAEDVNQDDYDAEFENFMRDSGQI